MKKINFVNGQEPALNDANFNQLQANIEEAIGEIGTSYTYTLTGINQTFATQSWVPIAEELTTDVIPAGKYLIVFIGHLVSAGDGLTTLNPYLDGARTNNYTRQTIPVGGKFGVTGSSPIIREFTEDSTHTVNVYQYASAPTNNGNAAVHFIRIQ